MSLVSHEDKKKKKVFPALISKQLKCRCFVLMQSSFVMIHPVNHSSTPFSGNAVTNFVSSLSSGKVFTTVTALNVGHLLLTAPHC